jgi:hypothetical protein
MIATFFPPLMSSSRHSSTVKTYLKKTYYNPPSPFFVLSASNSPFTMHDLEILVPGLVSEENTIAVLEESRYPRANPGVKLNDALEERVTRILDAFAHVLVARPSKEVIAVGFQMSQEEVIVTIASDETVKQSTIDQAYEIWRQLQKISRLHREEQRSFGIEQLARYEKPESTSPPFNPKNLPSAQEANIVAPKKMAYSFSIQKFTRRLDKPFQGATRCAKFLRIAEEPPNAISQNVCDGLKRVIKPLKFISGVFSVLGHKIIMKI